MPLQFPKKTDKDESLIVLLLECITLANETGIIPFPLSSWLHHSTAVFLGCSVN